jgi:hypothetical protein
MLFKSRSLATAVSLAPQFLLSANMPHYNKGWYRFEIYHSQLSYILQSFPYIMISYLGIAPLNKPRNNKRHFIKIYNCLIMKCCIFTEPRISAPSSQESTHSDLDLFTPKLLKIFLQKIHFNIILQYTHRCPRLFLSVRFSILYLICIYHIPRATFLAHHIPLDGSNNNFW